MVPVRLIRPPTLSGITFCQNQEGEADGELQRNVRRNQGRNLVRAVRITHSCRREFQSDAALQNIRESSKARKS